MLKRVTLLAFSVLFLAAVAFADSQARIVRLSYLEGNVQLDRGEGDGYIRAFLNMPLIEGASIWTKEDGRAEIEFEDGSTMRLTPDSIVHFRELRLRSDGSKSTAVELRDGVSYFNVRRQDDDSFRVTVGAREVSLEKHSQFRIVYDALRQPLELRLSVTKGEVRFLNEDGQRVSVRKNETLTIDFDDAGRYFLARGIGQEAHDYWDREREQDRAELARRAQHGNIYTADLHRYGSFVHVSGHGQLWRPFSVAFGWDPFANGAWVYYPGSGYVWISNYIWGWTPYRYGAWVHVDNYGWCWRPPGMYAVWAPRPVLINPPRHYVGPVVPNVPRGPLIRVGSGIDSLDSRDERRRRDADAPGVLVQDRVRGVRQVDAPISSRRVDSSGGGGVLPIDASGERGRRRLDEDDRDRPGDTGRVDTRSRTPRNVDGVKVIPGGLDGQIDAHRDSETPVRTTPAANTVTPSPTSTPTTQTPPVQRPTAPVIQDRPSRTPRVDAPAPRPMQPVQPVQIDRPSRPERTSPPPQVAPSNPAPRMQTPPPAPPPPPPRSAPVNQTGVKDQ